MKSIAKIFFASALMAALFSCSKAELQEGTTTGKTYGGLVFQINQEAKTTIDMTTGQVSFNAGDKIKFLYSDQTCEGEVKGEGSGQWVETDIPATAEGPFYAVYPADNAASLVSDVLTVDIPRVRTGKWADVSTMAAKTTKSELSLSFQHVCAYIAINVTAQDIEDGYVKYYVARGDDNGETTHGKMFGTQTVTFDQDEKILLGESTEGTGKYFCTMQTLTEEGTYFFPVLAGLTLNDGILLCNVKDGNGIRKSAVKTIARGKVAKCGNIAEKVAQNRYYITPAGAGLKDGSSWENAGDPAFFETMVNLTGPKGWLIGNSLFCFKGNETYQMNVGITAAAQFMVIGGYEGTGEPGVKDSEQYVTTFMQKVAQGTEPIVKATGKNVAPTFYGITFKDAEITGSVSGGAVKIDSEATGSFRACKFVNNKSTAQHAGAVDVTNANANFTENCVFTGNYAKNGGAMRVVGSVNSPSVTIRDCTFENNTVDGANGGGALYIGSGKTTLTNCTFKANEAKNGGAIMTYGGELDIINCILEGNVAKNATSNNGGGAIQMNSGAVVRCSGTVFKGNLVKGTVSSRGGAVNMITDQGCKFMANACVFDANGFDMATSGKAVFGSAIACQNSKGSAKYNDVAVYNCAFHDGTVTNATTTGIGAVMFTGSGLSVNCTYVEDTGTAGDLVRFANTGEGRTALYNNIIINKTADKTVLCTVTSNGYNLGGLPKSDVTAAATDYFDKTAVTEAALGIDFTVNAFGSWNGSAPAGYTKGADAAGAKAAVLGHSGIGEAFNTWLLSLDQNIYSKSGNGSTRTAPFWPGAYQN